MEIAKSKTHKYKMEPASMPWKNIIGVRIHRSPLRLNLWWPFSLEDTIEIAKSKVKDAIEIDNQIFELKKTF